MTRWDWKWEEPEGGSGSAEAGGPPKTGAVRRDLVRRALTVAALAVAVVAVVLAATGGSSGEHPRAAPAGGARVPIALRRAASRARSADQGIDAVLRRQAVVFEGGRRGHEVALTFDDGPGPYTPALLAELRRLRVGATFFAIGEMERYFAAGSRAEHRLGDVIADHTETHPLMARLPFARQQAEITMQTQWLARLGIPYPRLYRPPYGSFDATTLAVLRPLRMLLVLWSIDTQDYTRPGVGAIVRRALARVGPGAIILMHDGGGDRSETIAALAPIVRGLRRRGLHPVTIPRLLRDDPPRPGLRIPNLAGD